MQEALELKELGVHAFCSLDKKTGGIEFYSEPRQTAFTGVYFRDDNTFFGLYPSKNGPIIWYGGKEYPITKKLTINVMKKGDDRTFCVKEYAISMDYKKSICLGLDSWSTEMDVDLFYMLEQRYKTDEFYSRYTLNP